MTKFNDIAQTIALQNDMTNVICKDYSLKLLSVGGSQAAVVVIDALDQGTFLLNFVSDEKGFVSNFDIITIGKVTANDEE